MNDKPPKRRLDRDEHNLWQKVKKTVSPIDSKRQNLAHWLDVDNTTEPKAGKQGTDKSADVLKNRAKANRSVPAPYFPPVSMPGDVPPQTRLSGEIDDRTAKRLLKGRVSIDGRVDLHGMSQNVAHTVLNNFLHDAYVSGLRMVLVITGKGRAGEGVLRKSVPAWLKEPPLSTYVSACRPAHITHGGDGALYVRLRKNNQQRR